MMKLLRAGLDTGLLASRANQARPLMSERSDPLPLATLAPNQLMHVAIPCSICVSIHAAAARSG